MSWFYILTAGIRVSNSFSFLANSLMSSMYIKWCIFPSDLLSFYPPVRFLRMRLSGIIAIKNSNGDCASPWNIPFEFEWQQVSGTLLSVLAVLNNAVVWMVSTCPPTSKSSSPFNSSLVNVPNAPLIVPFMFHSFFKIPYQARCTYLSVHSLSVLSCGQPVQQSLRFCEFSFSCWLL